MAVGPAPAARLGYYGAVLLTGFVGRAQEGREVCEAFQGLLGRHVDRSLRTTLDRRPVSSACGVGVGGCGVRRWNG